jgi:hypothetical protein
LGDPYQLSESSPTLDRHTAEMLMRKTLLKLLQSRFILIIGSTGLCGGSPISDLAVGSAQRTTHVSGFAAVSRNYVSARLITQSTLCNWNRGNAKECLW